MLATICFQPNGWQIAPYYNQPSYSPPPPAKSATLQYLLYYIKKICYQNIPLFCPAARTSLYLARLSNHSRVGNMDFVTLILLVLGLSLDDFTIAVAVGLTQYGNPSLNKKGFAFRVAIAFTIPTVIFPLIGWLIGVLLSCWLEVASAWIILGVFVGLGAWVIKEACEGPVRGAINCSCSRKTSSRSGYSSCSGRSPAWMKGRLASRSCSSTSPSLYSLQCWSG